MSQWNDSQLVVPLLRMNWPSYFEMSSLNVWNVTLTLMWANSCDKSLPNDDHYSTTIFTTHVYCIQQSQIHNKVHIKMGMEQSPDQTARPALLAPDGPPLQPLQCPEISWLLPTDSVYHVKSFHLPTFPGLKITSSKWNLLLLSKSLKICR